MISNTSFLYGVIWVFKSLAFLSFEVATSSIAFVIFLVEATDAKAVKEFDRVALINENVIRHLVVKVGE